MVSGKNPKEDLDFLKTVTEASPVAITKVDEDGKIVYANRKAEEIFDLERSEITDRTYDDPDWKITDQEGGEYPSNLLPFNLVKDKGEPVYNVKHAIERPGGERKLLSINASPLYDEDGDFKGMVSVIEDVTRREQIEGRLKQYKMAVEGSDDLMAACDRDYNYLFANQAYRKMYRLEEEEIVGKKIDEVVGTDAFEAEIKPRVDKCLTGERIEYEMTRSHPERGERSLRIIYYPLRSGERIHGIVGVMRDITEQKKAEQNLSEERDKLKALHDAVDQLQQQESEGEVLQTAVEVAETMLDFELCALDLVEGDYLVTKSISSGITLEDTAKTEIGKGIAGKSIQKLETFWGEDLRDNPEAKPTSKDFRSYISIPIGDMGVFQVVSTEIGKFSQQDVELAEILVGHIKEELERVRLEEKLRQQAIQDPLTGLYNRRYFNETLAKEVERCERYGHSMAFLMIDVNRFKEINDRYSHQTGDEVLKEVAKLLKDNVRDADVVVRYGGDEFLIMMPETNGNSKETVDRLKTKLFGWNEQSDLLDFSLTLAIGVTHWNPDQDRPVEDALKEADRKMYADKDR